MAIFASCTLPGGAVVPVVALRYSSPFNGRTCRLLISLGCHENCTWYNNNAMTAVRLQLIMPYSSNVNISCSHLIPAFVSLAFQADAESLPFEDNSFHLYTIAFGLRNVTDVSNDENIKLFCVLLHLFSCSLLGTLGLVLFNVCSLCVFFVMAMCVRVVLFEA